MTSQPLAGVSSIPLPRLIAPPVGGLSHYLARLVSSGKYLTLRSLAQRFARKLPKRLHIMARRWEEYSRGFWTGGTLFEELGFYYVGPVDGHNLDQLIPVLDEIPYWFEQGFPETRKNYSESELRGEGWMLLAQFESSGDLMFGDAGAVYYVLPEADVRAGRFERAMGIMQCS